MRIGALDRRIQLQSSTKTRNAVGESVDDWSTYATVWANVRELRAKEYFEGEQKIEERLTKFIIRYRADVDEKHRVLYNDQLFDIQPTTELGRRQYLEFMGKAVEK